MALYQLIVAWALLLAPSYSAAIPSAASNSSNYIAITGTHTGIQGRNAPRPSRRNILDLQNDGPAWSLYIQALNLFQSADENYDLSYFQIAGIHGRPYVSWNDAPQAANAYSTGYCTHGSVLFLTWHRPYLALYEQILTSYAQDLVASYPPDLRPTYQIAADDLRLAYWDWAAIPQLPAIVEQPTVTITTGNGTQTVTNPLYQYKFHKFPLDPTYFPTSGAGDSFLAEDPATMRGVTSQGGSSNPDLVNQYLANSNLMRQTWLALVKSTSYDTFATTATGGTSVENVHNQIHSMVGLNFGHMSYLSYSAFDPIFWLHHANVDRLYAMWQAVNPHTWITPLSDQYGTFSISPGTTESASTPLEPFSISANGPWYDSSSARFTSTFGYTYPEIDDWNKTSAQLKIDVSASINQLYNPDNALSRRSSTSKSQLEGRDSHQTREWFVTLSVSKFDLQGQRFIVVIFLGSVPSDSSTWQSASNMVGSFPVFPPPPPPTTSGGYPQIIANSEYSLEDGLKAKGIDTQNLDGVETFLKENLAWGVMKFDGTVVPTSQLPSLTISVTDEEVTLPADNTQLPTYSSKTNHDEITKGKVGGAKLRA